MGERDRQRRPRSIADRGGLLLLRGRGARSAGTLDARAQRAGGRDLALGRRGAGAGVRAERDRVRGEGPLARVGGVERLSVRTRLRVVLDTNVWLDWLVFDDPSIAPIKAAVAANRVELFTDTACEAELERALGYDLGKRSVDVAACIAECRRVARRIGSAAPEAERARLPACRDPDDQKFLEAALAARAEFLVTRDRALLELARRPLPFRILAPEGFRRG
ncbi:MAG: putative toxin-antitoxin system toxin component, PIN family [Betaproteobacteria bacterium]|nr:MAG: putative toxin-antitoxin system toxin component, PIN family [Betaproteobacteria bacterium]